MRCSWRMESSMNVCKELLNVMGKIPLHLSLSGIAFWALLLPLVCLSADSNNNSLFLIRGFSCCQTPWVLCLPLLFIWTPLVWDLIEACCLQELMLNARKHSEGLLALINVIASQALAVLSPSPALCSLTGVWHHKVPLHCRSWAAVNTGCQCLKKSFLIAMLAACSLTLADLFLCRGGKTWITTKEQPKFSTSEYAYWVPNMGRCFIVAWVLGQMISCNVSSFIGLYIWCQNSLVLEKLGLGLCGLVFGAFFFFPPNSNASSPHMFSNWIFAEFV